MAARIVRGTPEEFPPFGVREGMGQVALCTFRARVAIPPRRWAE